MCLEYDSFNDTPYRKSGVGFKIVRNGYVKGTYRPYWNYFTQENGGVQYYVNQKIILVASDVEYRIGKTTKGHTENMAMSIRHGTYERKYYPAGIHLYKDYPLGDKGSEFIVILCRYEGAIAEDDNTVVADRITPIADVTRRMAVFISCA